MSGSALFGIVVTVVTVFVSVCIGLLATVVSVALPIGIMWFVYQQVRDGKATVVVSGPFAHVLASAAGSSSGSPTGSSAAASPAFAASGPQFVKRTRCRACGAPKVQRSFNAYVYCDFCGLLVDWDFQACLADKRSRLPGPTYEALLRSLHPKLAAARTADDRVAYRAAQVTIFDAYATACPAALPPRIGDPAYRKRLVVWQAESQADLDFDPEVAASLARQSAAVTALVWDRQNPFAPKIQPGSFDSLLDAVLAHQVTTTERLAAGGWLERHPDHVTAELFRHIGVSALVQGWMPFLKDGEANRVLARTGLKGEYDEVVPQTLRTGQCPSCGAGMQVVEGAKRVLCVSCGHLAGTGVGTVACHGCAAPVSLPEHGSLYACPHCEAELRMMRHG